MLLYFATHDGQSRLIANRIAARLTAKGKAVTPIDLENNFPEASKLAAARAIVLVAAVRYGRHLTIADRLMALCRNLSPSVPLAVASVSLAARMPEKRTAEGNPYLRKWLAHHKLKPALAIAFAGRLDYPRYGWLDRQLIRLIMTMTGGPADPTTQIEYTNWDEVDAFAGRIAALLDERPEDVKLI